MSANLIHDKEANVWVWTGKVFTFPEQINNFKETYADYKNKEEWRELLRVFIFYKQHGWAKLISENQEFADAMDSLHTHILYGKKLRIKDSLNKLIVIASSLNKEKEK
jgi:hypothetical protein